MAGRRGNHSTGWARRSACDNSVKHMAWKWPRSAGRMSRWTSTGRANRSTSGASSLPPSSESQTFMTKGPGREGRNSTDAELDQMAAAYEDLGRIRRKLGRCGYISSAYQSPRRQRHRVEALHGSPRRVPPLYGHVPRRALGLRPGPGRARLRRADRVRASARFQGRTDRGAGRRPHVRLLSIYGGAAESWIRLAGSQSAPEKPSGPKPKRCKSTASTCAALAIRLGY